MSDSDDPIRRSSDLGPPTVAEIINLHILAMLVAEKPKRLARVREIARDKAMATNVLRLHGRADDPQWVEAFQGAAIRIEGAAAMLSAALPPDPKSGKKKRSKTTGR